MKRTYILFLCTLFLLLPQYTKPQIFWFDSSKKLVVGCALASAGVAGVGAYWLSTQTHDTPKQKRENGFFSAAIGLIGGLIGGVTSYYTTPDSCLRAAHNTLSSLENSYDFQCLVTAQSLQELEAQYIEKPYHLYVIAQKLARVKTQLLSALYYFNEASQCTTHEMPKESITAHVKAIQKLAKVNQLLVNVKNNPNYLTHEKAYRQEQNKIRELRIKQQRVQAEWAKAHNKNSPRVHVLHERLWRVDDGRAYSGR